MQHEHPAGRLAPIQDIYNRIIWDTRLNKKAFSIGFIDRKCKTGLREKALSEWNTGTIEIPWHRIQYIRCGETKVWDRQQRSDLFASGRLPAEAWAADPENTALFLPQQVYEFTANGWTPVVHELGNSFPESLRLVTYNVLCDAHEKELIKTHLRIPAIVTQLKHSEADIIVLQEVTTPLLHALLQEPWVRQMYISAGSEGAQSEPQGILILARSAFTLSTYACSLHKQFLVGHWIFHQQQFHLAALHLTSNRSKTAALSRRKQLQAVLDYLQTLTGDAVIAGDCNSREEDLFLETAAQGFEDIWSRLYPADPGYTFDPRNNALAGKMTLSGHPARFDRILLRSADHVWKPEKAELFARQPLPDSEGQLFLSDHFALLSVLIYQDRAPVPSKISRALLETIQTVSPTYHSAIVLIPDESVWPEIQRFRRHYDRQYRRWMPHITLIYGFVPAELLEAASLLISDAVKDLAECTITLTTPGTFAQRAGTTGWVQPVTDPAGALHTLQNTLQKCFPTCTEQGRRARGFHPYLTLGQFTSEEAARQALASWQPVVFHASSVALISREGTQPFSVRYRVHLQTGLVEKIGTPSPVSAELKHLLDEFHPLLSASEKQTRALLRDLVTEACSEVLGQSVSLDLFGSSRLDIATPHSDLDLLCLIPSTLPELQFLEEVKDRLAPITDQARLVTNAQVPAVTLTIDSVAVDLVAACHPFFPAPLETLKEEDCIHYEKGSWRALVGCMEADFLLRVANTLLPEETFRTYLRAVRAWASVRKISGNRFGYLGNFSWAVLATWACRTYQPASSLVSVESLLMHFFQQVNRHAWPEPVGLQEARESFHAREKRDWMPILTSLPPRYNSARNLTRSTFHVIKEECARAAEAAKTYLENPAGFRALSTPYDICSEAQVCICLLLEAANEAERARCLGFLAGSFLSLLLTLEQRTTLLFRPSSEIERNGTSTIISLAIQGDPTQKQEAEVRAVLLEFEKLFYAWGERPEKSTLSLYVQKG